MSDEKQRQIDMIKEWAHSKANPMFTIHPVCRMIWANGWQLDSNDLRYRQVYRLLEKMVSMDILISHGTKNGGNVYMLRNRDVKAGEIQF